MHMCVIYLPYDGVHVVAWNKIDVMHKKEDICHWIMQMYLFPGNFNNGKYDNCCNNKS